MIIKMKPTPLFSETANKLLERLAGRKILVEMDGNQVGQSLNIAERSLQEK